MARTIDSAWGDNGRAKMMGSTAGIVGRVVDVPASEQFYFLSSLAGTTDPSKIGTGNGITGFHQMGSVYTENYANIPHAGMNTTP